MRDEWTWTALIIWSMSMAVIGHAVGTGNENTRWENQLVDDPATVARIKSAVLLTRQAERIRQKD